MAHRDFLGDLFVPALPAQNFEEDGDGIDRDADGALDGGVAGAPTGDGTNRKRRSWDCDLRLFLTCEEALDDLAPNHSILRTGVTVSIGLDKSTKLAAVFTRYADFCNEHSKEKIVESDLEFLHCQLLNGNDTAEASALMKGDRIRVRRDRTAEREKEAEYRRMQRESDREYFKQLLHLLPNKDGSRYCDILLDCQGRLIDETNGRNQKLLCTTVRAHSVLIEKRCQWLARLVQEAREERSRKRIVTIPDNEGVSSSPAVAAASDEDMSDICTNSQYGRHDALVVNDLAIANKNLKYSTRMMEQKLSQDEDDDDIGVLAYPVQKDHHHHRASSGAAEIENDDEDEDDINHVMEDVSDHQCRSRSPVIAAANSRNSVGVHSDHLWVKISNHNPEPIKLLLEYCYTNRVLALGQDAFVQACKTKPARPNGPVSPYHQGSSSSRRWPNGGQPTISFSVALSGISLAEEARMPRFSLMCEVAASQLVVVSNVVDALSLCTSQEKLTGNPLSRLRQAAIDIVLRAGPRGVYQLPSFRRALEDRTSSIVPTLLLGTMEAISSNENKRKSDNNHLGFKRDRSAITDSYFDDIDREDAFKREHERRIRRFERWENDPNRSSSNANVDIYDEVESEDYCDPVVSGWAAVSSRRSLKRMSHHLSNSSGFSISRSSSGGHSHQHSSRDTPYSRIGGYMPSRRRQRRRSADRHS